MAKKCCIPNCRLQKDDPGCLNLSFFQVPKDENTRNEWANNIKNYFKTEIKFKNCAYVCAMHFESSSFKYGGLYKVVRLKKGSCPTKFEKVEENEPIQSSSSANISDVLNDGTDSYLKESTVPLLSTDLTNNVSITKNLHENNVIKTQLDECQLSYVEDDFMNPEEVAKESEVNRSLSDSSNVQEKEIVGNIFRKSIVNINLDSINLNNTSLVRRLLQNAQAEVRSLRKTRKIQSMRLYRAKRKVKNGDSLISHVRQRNLVSEKVSEILKVSMKDC